MRYIGIDLGTTNSAICSYDGETVHLYKSPDQHDTTPSAIFIDKRGNKHVGSRAYNNAARDPQNAATLFKRLMGTNTPLKLSAVNVTMTPEECSAEILRTLFSYLPDEIRNSEETGTVVTVPAAFNQMQTDATMSAAGIAGIGRVALMQEPVAAVMSVMRQRKSDGIFLVYDLGGGTLDIAIAESISGRVGLLAHGGIEMCGGRDFDRAIVDKIVTPWLTENGDLPVDWKTHPTFKSLLPLATWAAEKAKIELSQKANSVISLSETESTIVDSVGDQVYLDVPISRSQFDEIIAPKLDESIQAARRTMEKAGLTAGDIERIVFVGGPTHYVQLRHKVAQELGIAPSTEVNPMTAVAEGAAVFAESIDWSSQSRGRKSSRGVLGTGGTGGVSFSYTARTPDSKARLVAKITGQAAPGAEFQVDNLDTGWSSGRVGLKADAFIDLLLFKPGENTFKVFVFDGAGGPLRLERDRIVITRTAASVDAIPASHSIGVEAREKLGGHFVIDYLVREGDQLPIKGKRTFKSEESLRSGAAASIKFKIWEGEIVNPIRDNRFIGMFEIKGSDLDDTVIPAGADLLCDYEILDSGNIVLEVTVPTIGGLFKSRRNFYSRQEGQIDYSNASKLVLEESERATQRLEEIATKAEDARFDDARSKLEEASGIRSGESDPEVAKQAMDRVQEAKQLMAEARKDHLKEIRQLELDKAVAFFDKAVRQHARPSEESAFANLAKTAQRSIDSNSGDFEPRLSEMSERSFLILWRQDWFVIDRFKWLAQASHVFHDLAEHARIVAAGIEHLRSNDIDKLRTAVVQLDSIRIDSSGEDDVFAVANILRG